MLDFTKAPFRLMAIAYRPDLRVVGAGAASIGGEGRFVFQVVGPTLGVDAASGALTIMDATVKPQKFTVIFEIPANVVDMQFATLQVLWRDTLAESTLTPIALEPWKFELDPAKTAEANK